MRMLDLRVFVACVCLLSALPLVVAQDDEDLSLLGTLVIQGNQGQERIEIPWDTSPLQIINDFCATRQCNNEAREQLMDAVHKEIRRSEKKARTPWDFPQAFSEILGVAKIHPTFNALNEQANKPETFKTLRAFWRYNELMGDARVSRANFLRWYHDKIFHIFASEYYVNIETLEVARGYNREIMEKLHAVDNAPLCTDPDYPMQPRLADPVEDPELYKEKMDFHKVLVESNGSATLGSAYHVNMLTFFLNYMGDVSNLSFLEIGGGYGNCARLLGNTYGFKSYTMFDLPHVSQLQEWHVGYHTPNVEVVRNGFPGEEAISNKPVVNSVDSNSLNIYAQHFKHADVLIALHSLSELPLDPFMWYFNNFVTKVDVLVFAFQTHWPHKFLIDHKVALIEEHFEWVRGANGEPLTWSYYHQHEPTISNRIYRRKQVVPEPEYDPSGLPTVKFLRPVKNEAFVKAGVQVKAITKIPPSYRAQGQVRVKMWLDEQLLQIAPCSDCTFPLGNLNEGPHTLTAQVVDARTDEPLGPVTSRWFNQFYHVFV